MERSENKTGLRGAVGHFMSALISVMLLTSTTPATGANKVYAVPDYGSDDCVSFKHSTNTDPLDFAFGYACVSEDYCEVSTHGCVDDLCHYIDHGKGTRTTHTNVPITSQIDEIIMGVTGKDLASNAQWCLVQDGIGNFWALDKQRGSSESFNLNNQHETIVPCKATDYFNSEQGCITHAAGQ